uniref:Receptor protein-tyrosine kinase n=1 Tax=Branchiostoma floridae TaxID=7739 RepID=C3ZRK2_BRAFL|eukprot:XP_002588791.1 hypothetical protein BRAFLDRAFT_89779 [Branchiostoma floridae]
MDHNAAFFILLTCLAVSDSVQGTLQLSANVPEKANVGETVTSVRPAIGEGREEVRCEIVAGDKNRRFLVTDCVIQVARPLDYNVDPSYNLTVNVTGSFGNPEQLYVDVQVQDVEGYPPVYNDTCQMPTRNGPGKSGDLNLDMKFTAEGIAMDLGENCTCENGARCHGLNGACKCQPGWQGVVCDIPHSTVVIIATPSDTRQIYITGSVTLHCKVFHLAADRMMWTFPNKTEKWLQGAQEDRVRIHNIQSEHNGTYTCAVLTGDGAVINASYELQAVACPPGKTGESCEEECVCSHGGSCDRWAGCVCPPGWTGTTCQTSCPVGTYGQGCSRRCRCQHDASCSPTDGRCNCTEGWFGSNCSRRCPAEETMVVLELRNMEEDLAQSLQPGWLNRWERNADDLTLDELVGLGASAQIRRGRLRTAGADVTVAVKSVRMEDRRCYRAFCREVAALIAVHENGEEENGGHPNIVKLFGVVTISTPKCILLEFAAKGELLLILKQPRQNRPLGRFVRYAVQISRALEELRRLRIAHGDVAARNVLVSGDDVAKLADFGLAHDIYTETTYVPAVNDDVDELLPLKWMALESLESREFTCESDTWSFGVLLWEIATFGEEPSYQRQRQLSCPKLVGLLRQGVRLDRPPGCPEKLYDVMKSCWREEPSARPEPAELEQRLTGCGKELDPLLAVDN